MTTEQLFRLFGGRGIVMAITGATRQATNHWKVHGVPYRHWPALRAAAEAAGIPRVSDASLASTRPRRKRQKEAAE